MPYESRIHHRRSIRLPGYDYTTAGYYFVTICTSHREVILDRPAIRAAIEAAWHSLAERFPGTILDEFIVMPNHVHGVLALPPHDDRRVGLGNVIRAFKSISAIAANRLLGRSRRPFWQRNYFERIIRSDRELLATREYIRNNPLNWTDDPENPERCRLA